MALAHCFVSFSSHLPHRMVPLRVTSLPLSWPWRPATKANTTTRPSATDHGALIVQPPLNWTPDTGPQAPTAKGPVLASFTRSVSILPRAGGDNQAVRRSGHS